MKKIEIIKFGIGLIFCFFAIIGLFVFFIGYFKLPKNLDYNFKSASVFYNTWIATYGSNSGHNYMLIFLGFCALAGAYLINNTKK